MFFDLYARANLEVQFDRVQADTAAKWLFDFIVKKAPNILVMYFDKIGCKEIAEKITKEQEKKFLTILSDSIWELAQSPSLRFVGQSSLSIYLYSKPVQEALKAADINLPVSEIHCVGAHLVQKNSSTVSLRGKVTYEDGKNVGDCPFFDLSQLVSEKKDNTTKNENKKYNSKKKQELKLQ